MWCRIAGLLLGLAAPAVLAQFDGGHVKFAGQLSTYPDDSEFRSWLDAVNADASLDSRANFAGGAGRWSWQADYQLLGRFGDTLGLADVLGQRIPIAAPVPDDETRWWDLTAEISDGDRHAVVHRLDRLSLAYTGDKTVLRLGRQAVSWGNGLIFNPMDFLNPFGPAAVDTEYKLGDDMLYGQYLLDSGSDWQMLSVVRRDERGDVTAEVASGAIKFHGFGFDREYDLLLAQHYDDTVLALGGSSNWGDAVVRADAVFVDAEDGWVASAVANWSYSWAWGGYNISAVGEYYFNGFGLRESDYTAHNLAPDTALGQRLQRGELFTLGRHYLGTSLQIELTPLLQVTPNLFVNLGDSSALAQVVARWEPAQDWQVLASCNLPLGPKGTEYGGLVLSPESGALSRGPALWVQVGYYF